MYYNKELGTCCISIMGFILSGCTSIRNSQPVQPKDTSLVNTSRLDYLYTPLSFSTGVKAAGIFLRVIKSMNLNF
jgi:hypothetical protein